MGVLDAKANVVDVITDVCTCVKAAEDDALRGERGVGSHLAIDDSQYAALFGSLCLSVVMT
eukprot:gene6491-3814_t